MEPALRRGRLGRELESSPSFLFSREIFLGVSTISVQIYVEYRYTQNRMADGKRGASSASPCVGRPARAAHPARATKVAHARPRATRANRIVLSRVHSSERPRREETPPSPEKTPAAFQSAEPPVNQQRHATAGRRDAPRLDGHRERVREREERTPEDSPSLSARTRASHQRELAPKPLQLVPPGRVLAHENVRLLRPHAVRGRRGGGPRPLARQVGGAPTNLPRGEYPRARRHRRRRRGGRRRAPGQARRVPAAPGDVYKVASSAAPAGASAPRVDESKTTQKRRRTARTSTRARSGDETRAGEETTRRKSFVQIRL